MTTGQKERWLHVTTVVRTPSWFSMFNVQCDLLLCFYVHYLFNDVRSCGPLFSNYRLFSKRTHPGHPHGKHINRGEDRRKIFYLFHRLLCQTCASEFSSSLFFFGKNSVLTTQHNSSHTYNSISIQSSVSQSVVIALASCLTHIQEIIFSLNLV